ncbi:MAG: c-type cytochrome [Bradyrhizobium sp.]|nr:MAG: c-type cytochrome [Bradyrhizobium sp.]
MKRALASFAALVALAAVAAWVLSAPQRIDAAMAAEVSEPGDVAAGRIVFYAGGCDSCHASPGQGDRLKLGGGAPLATPFGVFYPPNISPDVKDGIGDWSATDFANALHAGVGQGGEQLYPAFPYPSYRLMTMKDVRDLFAYLKTLPPVAGKAPESKLDFPFNIRRAVGLWKLVYLGAPPPAPAGKSEAWLLGRYLVEGPGHCGECHSPRDWLGGVAWSRRLQGGPLPDGKGKAPALTPANLKNWSKDDIAEALSSSLMSNGDLLGGAMAEVVRDTAELPPPYRAAIAEYLKGGRE